MSAAFGVDAELHEKLEALANPDGTLLEEARVGSVFARIVWSRLAEPGDGTAGALIATLGEERALELLIARTQPGEVTAELRAAGAELSSRTVGSAIDRWLPRLDRGATIADIDHGIARRLRLLTPDDHAWPNALADLGFHAPTVLWLRGDATLLNATSLSVVGARAATGYGTHATADIVGGCCRAGITIVSGAAYGIDAVAHRTALAAEGSTVAVLAGGADRAYPAAHESLLDRIGREGLVCSEMIPGSAPTKWRFRMRNRIIAALSQATLVTEAGVRSGTINTAGHAAELGRVLGAMPGPVSSAASAGCHRLVREYGAVLVTNATEACEMLGIDDRLSGLGGEPSGEEGRMLSAHQRVLDAFPLRGARGSTEIARKAGFSVAAVRNALAELELLGRVTRHEPGGSADGLWALVRR